MRYTYILILLIIFSSCDSGSFDKDKRQIMAKDVLRSSLPPRSTNFDVSSFIEDTLPSWKEFEHPLQYRINYTYTDSSGALQQRKGVVIFTPDGHSVISSQSTTNP